MIRKIATLAVIVVISSVSLVSNPINDVINRIIDFEGFWGAILVSRGDVILHAGGYGMADIERNIPNTPEKKFRIASITKQFTAAAILRLCEDGLMSLSDPVGKFIPEFQNGDIISIEQMLNHSSGIPTMINTQELREEIRKFEVGRTLQEAEIAYISSLPLRFEPGSSFLYSNSAYFLLSVIIERASGKRYDDYLRSNFFEPLGMNNTGYDYNEYDSGWGLPYYCDSYVIDLSSVRPADWVDRRLPGGAGGLYSTVYDLYLWDRALSAGEVLSESFLRLMQSPSNELFEAGYGVFIGNELIDGEYRRVVYHDGDTKGTSTRINRYVDDDIFVVVLSNIEGRDFTALAYELAKAVIVNDMGTD
ncbi:serine hydrolase domain-containing protein [uncultured Mesotoga sp.]|uniref:serine hydrolase domain-containing protein n=1 Tax=uncultured Mesotoga sp. TaxID=1184400 RepID=UPI002595324E|nr:serine hydrolase domain-containing protein [uncultured Mesotoga sp.]